MSAQTWFALAKVNLGLSVLGVRQDGYHELSSLMVPLSIGDTLTAAPAPVLTLTVGGPYGAGLPTDGGNLVFRAAHAYLQAAGVSGGASLHLHKELPLASGLGGGSSDAAATLRALNALYPAAVDLPALALQLGADVPFFLLDGPALAGGVGEQLCPVPDLIAVSLVLANPGVPVSARDAYSWLDASGKFGPPLRLEALQRALAAGAELPYFNSLQPAVTAHIPAVEQALEALAGAGLHSVLMSGSGASCFGLARDTAQAEAAAQTIRAAYPGWWVRTACISV